MAHKLIEIAEQKCRKTKLPQFRVGETVDVYLKIVEGTKERIQIFNGVVIARRGSGSSASFTVRRIVNNEGVERTFMLHSPFLVDVKTKRRGKTRRAKLYYLRHRIGKARKLREIRISSGKKAAKAARAAGERKSAEQVETAGV